MNTNANNEVKMDATNTADAADTTQTASGADQAKADTTQESTVDESLRKARRKSVLKSTGKMVGRVTLGLAAVAGTVFAGRYLYNRYGVTVPVVEG